MTLDSPRRWAILGSIAYATVFHVVYATVIAPSFAYSGSIYAPVSDVAVGVAGIAAILPSLWLPSRLTRPSQVSLWLMYLVGYIPASLVIYYVLERDIGDLWPFTLVLLTSMAILGFMDRLPRTYWVVPVGSSVRSFSRYLAIAALATIGYIAGTVGINLQLPDLVAVGEIRASFGEAVGNAGPVLAYVVVWSANVVGPLLIAIGLRSRRLPLVALGVLLELVIYGITGFKTALFSSVLVLGLVALFAVRRHPSAASLAWITAVLVVTVAVIDRLNGSIVATSIFVRRLLEVPALVTSWYFEFFSENPTYGLAHSFLRTWVRPPSELPPAEVIGSAYFGPATSANGGLWADAFANFGFLGMLIFPAILGGVFWLLDVVADRVDLAVTGSVAGILGVIMTNTALFTTLMSHGLGLAIILFAVLPRSEAVPHRGWQGAPARGEIAGESRVPT
jgi:hypothetical protein